MTLQQADDKRQQEVRSGDGYISQSDLRLHFGLGKSEKAKKLIIRWPSGLVETLSDLPANHYYLVREGRGVDASTNSWSQFGASQSARRKCQVVCLEQLNWPTPHYPRR